jgi:hypothetical protein
MEHIEDAKTFDMNFYENYIRDMIIRQLDEHDEPVYTCRVFEVYPSSVESITLSNNSRSELSKLNVTLAFRFWREDSTKTIRKSDVEGSIVDKIGFNLEDNVPEQDERRRDLNRRAIGI